MYSSVLRISVQVTNLQLYDSTKHIHLVLALPIQCECWGGEMKKREREKMEKNKWKKNMKQTLKSAFKPANASYNMSHVICFPSLRFHLFHSPFDIIIMENFVLFVGF